MLFKIRVKSHQGDTVSVNIPIALLKVLDFNSFVNNGNSTDDNTAETDDGKDSSGDKKNVFKSTASISAPLIGINCLN